MNIRYPIYEGVYRILTFAAASLQTNCSATAKLLQCCCKSIAVTLQKVCSRFAVAVQYDSKLCMAMLQRAEKD